MPSDPLAVDVQRLLVNVRQATTEDLLNRVTVYRAGMEPAALAIITDELHERRHVTSEEIQAYAERMEREVIWLEDGLPARCGLCPQPAVAQGWGWFRLFHLIPIVPRRVYYCREHSPAQEGSRAGGPPAPRGHSST